MKLLRLLPLFFLGFVSCEQKVECQHPLADADATPQTVNLFRNMDALSRKGLMFGHQDALAYGIGWENEEGRSDVKSVCGDYPAVYGWDMGGIELRRANNIDGVSFDKIRQWIISAYENNAVNTLSWHCINPLTDSSTWDVTNREVVASILPGGEKEDKYRSWLDNFAEFVASLKTADGTPVPVIFRPYHEHTGSWFWWGKDLCTVEQYKELWRYTFDYLRDKKGLHNLLYAYSPSHTDPMDEYFERYPGDEYVDILGIDIYQIAGQENDSLFVERLSGDCMRVDAAAKQRGKLFALTETGLDCIDSENWFTGVLARSLEGTNASYALVWRNALNRPNHFFGPHPGHKSSADFVRMKESGKVFFQSDLKDMYK